LLRIARPGVRLELLQDQGTVQRLPHGKDAYLQHFQELDGNRDGLLSRTEAQGSPFFGKLFSLLDRNDDKMVSLKETEEYLDLLQEEQFLAMASRVHLLMSQPGQGLFDLLDQNQDGRLSLHEIRELGPLFKTLDADGNGQVTREAIPTVYRLAMGLSQASFNRHGGNVVQLPPQLPNQESADLQRGGPLWFRKMDRNRDGYVSRREFLGTKEEFDKLDTDGDGLISPEEAARARR
jgi:Ca2+-binding EF-hand superfamily protein